MNLYRIRPRRLLVAGIALDVPGSGTANGTAVDIGNRNGGGNQKWGRQ